MSTSGYRSVCLSVRPFLSRLSIHLSVLAAFINLLSLKSLHLPSEKNKRPLDCRPVRTRIKTQTAHTHSSTHTHRPTAQHTGAQTCVDQSFLAIYLHGCSRHQKNFRWLGPIPENSHQRNRQENKEEPLLERHKGSAIISNMSLSSQAY